MAESLRQPIAAELDGHRLPEMEPMNGEDGRRTAVWNRFWRGPCGTATSGAHCSRSCTGTPLTNRAGTATAVEAHRPDRVARSESSVQALEFRGHTVYLL